MTVANEKAGASWRRISLRQALLLLVLVGNAGLIAELLLLGHTESFNQWIPLIALVAGTISTLVVMIRPGYGAIALVRVHVGAANEARRLKPSIPLIGFDGIPVRDEIELEMQLEPLA